MCRLQQVAITKPVLCGLFTALFGGIGISVSAQQAYPDSLSKVLLSLPENPRKVDRLNAYASLLLRNQPAFAQNLAEESLMLAEEMGYHEGMAEAHRLMGSSDVALGFVDDAFSNYNLGMQVCSQYGLLLPKAAMLRAIGNLFMDQNDLTSAVRNYEQSLAICRTSGDSLGVAKCLNNLGSVYSSKGEYSASVRYFITASDLFRLNEQENLAATAYDNIGNGYTQLGDFRKATLFFERAIKVFEKNDDMRGLGLTYRNMASCALAQKQYDAALGFISHALTLLREIPLYSGVASSLGTEGDTYLALKSPKLAEAAYEESLTLLEPLGITPAIIEVYLRLALVYEATDPDKSLECLQKATGLTQSIEDQALAAQSNRALAAHFMERHLYDRALTHITVCTTLIEQGKIPAKNWYGMYELASRVYVKLKQPENAATAKGKFDALAPSAKP